MASNPKSLGTFEVEFSHTINPKIHFHHGFLPPVHRPPLVSNVPTSASPMGPLTSLRTGQKTFADLVEEFGLSSCPILEGDFSIFKMFPNQKHPNS